MTEAHPVAATFLKNAVQNGATLIVVDPRKQPLTKHAKIFAQIKVGTDVAFLNGVMHVLIKEDLYDKEFVEKNCVDFEILKETVMKYPPERSADICKIKPEIIVEIARTLASIKPAMLCYTLGITEHTCGKNNVMSTANLQMLLGNMGMESAGVNPLRGQNNVQGACDMGALPNVYHGYQKGIDPAAKEKFEKAWGVTGMSDKNGIMMPDMLEGLVSKKIKGFWIFGENLANSEPNISHVEHCLESADFLVVQDIFPNETTKFADVILPSASWSEDEGTFASSERRINRVRKVKTPPGEAKPNWWIFKQTAKQFGHEWIPSSGQELWDNEISVLAPAYGGVKYARLENDGIQWPCPTAEHPGTKFLHKDGKFSHGKGVFKGVEWTPPAEVENKDFPFVLSTGRRLYQYHTRTQTGRAGMDALYKEETADISIADALRLGIEHGEKIYVESRRGKVHVKARVTEEVPAGMVWMTFHYREGNANWLTNPAFDPETKTAEYKACAVNVFKE